jgi:hypothetical protein
MPCPDARRVIRAADELHPTHFHDHPRQPFADARRFKRKSTNRREKIYWRKLKRDKGEAPSERWLPASHSLRRDLDKSVVQTSQGTHSNAAEHRLEAYATLGFRTTERLPRANYHSAQHRLPLLFLEIDNGGSRSPVPAQRDSSTNLWPLDFGSR